MATILPLRHKYYGTEVKLNNDSIINIWIGCCEGNYEASQREIDLGWTPVDGFDHVETRLDFEIATIVCNALTDKGF